MVDKNKLLQIKELAKAASTGPWFFDVDGPSWNLLVTANAPYYHPLSKPVAYWPGRGNVAEHGVNKANAQYIASVDPNTIIELIDDVLKTLV